MGGCGKASTSARLDPGRELKEVTVATRSQLVDVSGGFASSFCSRNNDYKGAWLPGVLCARTLPTESIFVDLFGATPKDRVLATAQECYHQLLLSIMNRISLPTGMFSDATFAPRTPSWTREEWKVPREVLPRPTWWFTATVTITDDRGRSHSVARTDWCWPDTRRLHRLWPFNPTERLNR